MSQIFETVRVALERDRRLLKQQEDSLKKLPDGYLSKKEVKGYTYLYHNVQAKAAGNGEPTAPKRRIAQRCLNLKEKADVELAAALQYKRYLQSSLPVLRSNVKCCDYFVRHYQVQDPAFTRNTLPAAYRLPAFQFPHSEDIHTDKWAAASFRSNPLYPEKLLHATRGGCKVRSKSEALICEMLYAAGVPFRYEAALDLGCGTFYPDFTILRKRDRKLIYWEHAGMADENFYLQRHLHKLEQYAEYEILPWENLIVTYDRADGSIDLVQLDRIIGIMLK